MPPKTKKTKAEEVMAFLSDLDSLQADEDEAAAAPSSQTEPRRSTDSSRNKVDTVAAVDAPAQAQHDEEAASALAFLEAQINHKRAPLSMPTPAAATVAATTTTPRISTPQPSTPAPPVETGHINEPTASSTAVSGWGVSSLWSTAASALQSAQRAADEQYKKVRAEGVSGVTGQLDNLNVGGVDIGKLRKGAEERLGGIVKGVGNVDLDKLRHDLLNQANSTLTTFINTVAPPISAHETIELWLSHPMVGYGGVEGVVYRAWIRILEQTESGELIIIFSAPEQPETSNTKRSLNPVSGWDAAWDVATKEVEAVKLREQNTPHGRGKTNPEVPVTTVPVFLHLQPVLGPLPFPEPAMLLTSKTTADNAQHLSFIVSLQDPSHGIQFTTVSQPTPADWLAVEYERSDWVEERLVDVLKTAIEIIAQDYVATRMGLKPSVTRPASPVFDAGVEERKAE